VGGAWQTREFRVNVITTMPGRFQLILLTMLVAVSAGARAGVPDDQWKALGASIKRDRAQPLSRIAFGSCFKTDFPLGVWDVIAKSKPDLFLFIGDVIYKDTEDMEEKRVEFVKLGAVPGFANFRKSTQILAMWDDHDYGENDGGADYPKRDESKSIFLDFFGEPLNSPRRRAGGGMYHADVFGPPGTRVQVILLDGRYHRGKLDRDMTSGGYHPLRDPKVTMLGDEQWKWLEERLHEPAEIRLICSGIQVVPQDQPNEKWENLPLERERLFKLIGRTGAAGVIFLSGDRHHGEISAAPPETGAGYPLYDVTSSGMNCPHKPWQEPNRLRVGNLLCADNFGVIEIDWSKPDPAISLIVCNGHGDPKLRHDVPMSHLRKK
jgi:alkaline phosphatase D